MRQHRSVLGNKAFIRWAHENVVVLVAHNELGHDEREGEAGSTEDGDATEPSCPLYPGLRCRDHLNIAVDVENSRQDHLPAITFVALCPNTWLISPFGGEAAGSDGEAPAAFEAVPEKVQFESAALRKQVAALQKRLGDPLPRALEVSVRQALATAAVHTEEERVGEALRALAVLDAHGAKLPLSLRRLVADQMEALDEEAAYRFDEARDEGDREAAEALLTDVDVEVLGHRLPTVAAIKTWLTSK